MANANLNGCPADDLCHDFHRFFVSAVGEEGRRRAPAFAAIWRLRQGHTIPRANQKRHEGWSVPSSSAQSRRVLGACGEENLDPSSKARSRHLI
jgi:hypothetical protein